MSISLLFPMALAALVAIIVPLVIHIARKSEQHPIDFAAFRWLRQKPRPRSRLRFDEWLLLLLRLLLVSLVALLLSMPVLFDTSGKQPYIAIVPGSDLSGLTRKDAHWVAPDFPSAETPPPPGEQPTASLIRQLDAELSRNTPLTIIAPRDLSGADADRLRLSRKINWRVVGGAAPFRTLQAAPAPRLAIRHDGRHFSELRYLRAVSLAWREGTPDIANVDAPLPGSGVALAWLGSGPVPGRLLNWIRAGGTTFLPSDGQLPAESPSTTIWRDANSKPVAIAAPLGTGRLIRFVRPLQPASLPELLDADFPAKLRSLVQPDTAAAGRVMAADYAPTAGTSPFDPPPIDLRPWVALCIALIFALERWFATHRSRSAAP